MKTYKGIIQDGYMEIITPICKATVNRHQKLIDEKKIDIVTTE